MRGTSSFALLIACLALVLTGCATKPAGTQPAGGASQSPAGANQPAAGAKREYTINYPNTPWYDIVYVALERGYLEEAGIKVNFVGELPAGQLVPAVASGKIDFANRMAPLVITANNGGANLRLIGGGAQSTHDQPHMRYFVKKDSPIKEIKDVVGKKIGINSFGACAEFVTSEKVESLVPGAKLDFAVIADAQQEQALLTGQIQMAIVHAPFSKKLANNPEARELTSDYLLLDSGISGMLPYFTRDDYAKKNPELVKGFLTAISKGAQWAKKNPEEAAKIIGKHLRIEPKDVEAWAYYSDQVVPDKEVQYWIDLLEKRNQIPKGKFKLADLVDNSYNPAKVISN